MQSRRRLEAVSPQSQERDEGCCHRCQHCPAGDDERGCGPELRFASFFNSNSRHLSRLIKFLSSRFHSLELEVVEIVLDEWLDLLVPYASSKANLDLLLIERFEFSE